MMLGGATVGGVELGGARVALAALGIGTYYIIVRAVSATGNYEERNIDTLILRLDPDGNVLNPLPNIPTLILNSLTFNGRQVSARITYNTTDEVGVATSVQLFARNPGSGYILSSPITSGVLSATSTNLKSATLTYTFPSDQVVYLAACALTAANAQSPISNEVGPYNPSTGLMPAPDDFLLTVSRG